MSYVNLMVDNIKIEWMSDFRPVFHIKLETVIEFIYTCEFQNMAITTTWYKENKKFLPVFTINVSWLMKDDNIGKQKFLTVKEKLIR